MIQEPNYIEIIANELNLDPKQVKAVFMLVEEWSTVPFIARYRKEKTGNLDEKQIREILELKKKEENLYNAKLTALKWINEKWKLTDELKQNIINAKTLKEVEEIYKPYKSKRKTKAMLAEEKWLLPVAKLLTKQPDIFNKTNFKEILKENLSSWEWEKIKDLSENEIIEQTLEILSSWIVQNTKLRDFLRKEMLKNWIVCSKIKWEKYLEKLPVVSKEQIHKFDIYKDFCTNISKIKSYQILAINRWEKLWILTKKIVLKDFDDKFYSYQAKLDKYNFSKLKNPSKISPYKKLYESVENEVFSILKEKAEDEGIEVFQSNLFELLMTKPTYGKSILAIDPGFKTWSKIVLLDKLANPVKFWKIYLHNEQQAKDILKDFLESAEIVVIGNGTASWETAELLLNLTSKPIYIVNESWASVYSASKVAQEEFPNLDLTDRGTVSIWRRFIDPLSELVKIPVWSIGVWMYQHDMPEKKLEEKLSYVVEDVVNQVGINVNTASVYVLKNISWIDLRTAKKIYKNRPYNSREDLKKILSEKTYQQAIWFLRVPNSDEFLDNTDIHPQQYDLAKFIQNLKDFDITNEENADKIYKKYKEKLQELYPDVNSTTIKFIIKSLKNAGKDPRKNFAHKKAEKKLSLDDVKEGDILEWIVRNIMPFGAFVDIGLKNDGLVHISELTDKFVKNVADIVQIWDKVKVKIIAIDKERWKIQLSMKNL